MKSQTGVIPEVPQGKQGQHPVDDWNQKRRLRREEAGKSPWIPLRARVQRERSWNGSHGSGGPELLLWGSHPISHGMTPHGPIPAVAPTGMLRDLREHFHGNS